MQAVDQAIHAQDIHAKLDRALKRGEYTPRELLKLTRKAAGLALSGKRFSTEERVEVAARILADGLADFTAKYGPGALPTRTDRAHGFTAYYRRAGRERARIDAQRAKQASDQAAYVPEQGAYDAEHETLLGGATELVRGPAATAAQARAITEDALAALNMPHASADLRAVLYAAARDLPEQTVADELGLTVNAYWKARARGRKILAARYPAAADLLHALTGCETFIAAQGNPTWREPDNSPCEGPELRFTVAGRTTTPHGIKRQGWTHRTGALGQELREADTRGIRRTATGQLEPRPRIERPQDAWQARAAADVRFDPTQKNGAHAAREDAQTTPATTPDPTTIDPDEARADALAALSFALRR